MLPLVFAQRTDIKSDVWRSDLTFERGKRYLVKADSGTGKSSLLSYLIGHRNDYDGQLLFDTQDARRLSIAQWTDMRKRTLSLMYQELRLFPELTAMENVEIKNQLTRHKTKEQLAQWFEALGIADKQSAKVGKMSFGQQQRVALIRALCQPFSFIMLDEPISHLDHSNALIMARLLQEEATSQGAGVIVTSIGNDLPLTYDQTLSL